MTGHEDERESRTPVMVRIAEILDCFADARQSLILTEVVHITGLPRSTVFRLLIQLVELGWLERYERGYRLGQRVIQVGARRSNHGLLREAAHPVLVDLHVATGGIIHLGVLEAQTRIHFIDKIGVVHSRAFPSHVGLRYPVERTASGKSILSAMPLDEAECVIAQRERESGLQLLRLREELQTNRRRSNVAITHGHHESRDINSVGAPILGPEGPVGAVSIGGAELQVEPFMPMVLAAAWNISARLYPRWVQTRRGAQRGGSPAGRLARH